MLQYIKNPYQAQYHQPILQAIQRQKMQQFANAPIQLKPIDVQITGLTHLVQEKDGSIFEGNKEIEVTDGETVKIETDVSLWSRRGPNQENPDNREKDSQGVTRYKWYKVIGGNNYYLRDETFVPVSKEDKSLFTNQHIDPARRMRLGGNNETTELAKTQTKAARKLLYQPNDLFKDELGQAAQGLHDKIKDLGIDLQKALGGRILGKQGILAGKSTNELLALLFRVANDSKYKQASATDRAAVIALMGDIGALYADTGATTGVENRSTEQAKNLQDKLFPELIQDKTHVERVQKAGGSEAMGPLKKQERSRPFDKILPIEQVKPRTGIHNVGNEVDNELNIHQDKRITPATWQVAHVSKNRVNAMKEPLAGHMSGSPAEILQIWDALRGIAPEKQFTGALNNQEVFDKQESEYYIDSEKYTAEELEKYTAEELEKYKNLQSRRIMSNLDEEQYERRLARAAGASAFLVSGGYHSSVEVAEGTLAYMGQSLRKGALESDEQDAGDILGNGAATDLIKELHESFTD